MRMDYFMVLRYVFHCLKTLSFVFYFFSDLLLPVRNYYYFSDIVF